MKSKTKIVVLVAAMLVALAFSVSLSNAFSDTTGDNAKYEIPANELFELGIISGYMDGSIGVNKEVTRAEFAKILVLTMGKESEVDDYESSFNFLDVADNHWAKNYIGVAVDNGYLAGYPDGTFLPERKITNFEVVSCFVNLLGYDVNESSIIEGYLNKAGELGMLENVSDIVPEDNVTRGNLILVLWNALNIKVNGTQKTLLGMNFSYDIVGTLDSVKREIREINGESTMVFVFEIDGNTYTVTDTENFEMWREGSKRSIDVTITELLEDEENNSYLGQICTLERSEDDASPISLYFGEIEMKHAGQFFLVSDGVWETSKYYSIGLIDMYGEECSYQFRKRIEYPAEIDANEYNAENPKFVFIEFDEDDEIVSIELVKFDDFYYTGEDSIRYKTVKITGNADENTSTIPTAEGDLKISNFIETFIATPVWYNGRFESIQSEYCGGGGVDESLFSLDVQEGSFVLCDDSRILKRADLIFAINKSIDYEIRYGIIDRVAVRNGKREVEIDSNRYLLNTEIDVNVGEIASYVVIDDKVEILDLIKTTDLDDAKTITDVDGAIFQLKDGTIYDTDAENDYEEYRAVLVKVEANNIGEQVSLENVELMNNKGLSAINRYNVGDRIVFDRRNEVIVCFRGLGKDDLIKDGYLVEEPNKTIVELNSFIKNGIVSVWHTNAYNGQERNMTSNVMEDMDENIITATGILKATEPGEYTINVALKDKTNYVWDLLDDEHQFTSEDLQVKWGIPKKSNAIYTPSQRVLKTFTGSEIEIQPEDVYMNEAGTRRLTDYIDTDEFNITGNKATEPGDYEMLLTVSDPTHFVLHKFYDDTEHNDDEIAVSYTIEKIRDSIYVPTQRVLKTYTGESVKVTIDEVLMDAKLNGRYLHLTDFITEEYYEIENADSLAIEPGDYTLKVKLTDEGKKYVQLGDGSKDYVEIDYTIQKVRYSFYSKSQRFLKEATGEEIDITKSGAFRPKDEHLQFFRITGNIQKDPGEYVATIEIIDTDHCEFTFYGGTAAFYTLTINWEIANSIQYGIVTSGDKAEKQIELANGDMYYLDDDYNPRYLVGHPIAFKTLDNGKIMIEKIIEADMLDDAWVISSNTDEETIRFTDNSILGRDLNGDFWDRNVVEITVEKSSDGRTFEFSNIEYKGVGIAKIKNEAGVRVLRGDSYEDGDYPYYFVFVGLAEDEKTKEGQIFKTEKKLVNLPSTHGMTYTGEEFDVEDFVDVDEDLYIIKDGTLKATEPGRYEFILSLIDKDKYAWNRYEDDGLTPTSENQTLHYSIDRVHNYLYSPSQKVLKTYTGEEQEVTFEELSFNGHVDKKWFDITGSKATEVGSYEMKLTLNDNAHAILNKFYDNPGEENVITIEWKIQSGETGEHEHSWGEWQVIKEATCIESGEEQRVCELDSEHTETREIAKKAHELDKIARVEATTSKAGNIEYYKCKVCEKLFSDDKAEKEIKKSDTIIPKQSSGGSSGGGSSSKTKTYTTSVSSKSTQGTVTLEPKKVEEGDNQKITITPKNGYKVADVKVNGKSVGAVLEYTIKDVEKNNTVEVIYEKITENESGDNKEPVVDPTNETSKLKEFKDVKDGDWYKDSVEYVSEKGLFKGTSEDEFSPNRTMNRAMLVTVLHRLAGEPQPNTSSNKFTDIDANGYYAEAVNWAVENGIINGIDSETFGTDSNISREQLVTILYRYAKLLNKASSNSNNVLTKYEDESEISDYAEEAFAWAVSEGIITGRTTTTLSPKGTGTRAEVATMIMRFAEKVK